jgi:putative ABC transport system permease protein
MSRRTSPLVTVALAFVHLVSLVVPRRDRDAWRREWEAELLHGQRVLEHDGRASFGTEIRLGRRALGSLVDAAWLRRQFTRDSEVVHDARHALRLYRRAPGLLTLVVAVLAAGIGSATAVFGAVDAAFLQPLPLRDESHVVVIRQESPDSDETDVAPANFLDWRQRLLEADIVAAAEPYSRDYFDGQHPETLPGARVTDGFFDVFGIAAQRGRLLTADDFRARRNVAVLSDAAWRRRFGAAPDIIGQSFRFDDETFEIAGVLPAGFEPRLLGGGIEIWTPKLTIEDYERRSRGGGYWNVVARLRPDRSTVDAQVRLDAVSAELAAAFPRTNHQVRAAIVPIRDHLAGTAERSLLILAVGSLCILLLALGSVANLQLGLLAGRVTEFAVRRALGAARGRLVRQVFGETIALAMLAVTLGIGLAWLLLGAIRAITPDVPIIVDGAVLTWRALLFAGLLALAAAFSAAALPVVTVLRSGAASTTGGTLSLRSVAPALQGRSALVVVQIALALVLVVAAGLLGQSLTRLLSVDTGLETRNLLALQVFAYDRNETAAQRTAFFQSTLARIAALPGVERAGAASTVPFLKADLNISSPLLVRGRVTSVDDAPRVFLTAATPGYFEAAGISLRRGRTFTPHDVMGARGVAIVNDTTARREWPNEDPIGRIVEVVDAGRRKTVEVIGVVADLRYGGLHGAPRAEVFLPHAQSPSAAMTYVVRTSVESGAMLDAARRAVWTVDPLQTFYDAGAVPEMIRTSVRPRLFVLRLVAVFAAIGILVAVAGAYGAVAWSLQRRTAEFGVRMALGARASDIRRAIVGYAGRLAGAGIAIGLAGAVAFGRTLHSFLFGVDAADPVTLGLVALAVFAAVILAAAGPARRAGRIDPATALRR